MSNHKYNTRLASGKLKRQIIQYSNNSSNNSSDDSSSDYENEIEDENKDENEIEMDNRVEYYKFLNKIFPSNYSKNKIQKVKRQRLKSPEKTKIVTKNKQVAKITAMYHLYLFQMKKMMMMATKLIVY